jgi:hypothetical protein
VEVLLEAPVVLQIARVEILAQPEYFVAEVEVEEGLVNRIRSLLPVVPEVEELFFAVAAAALEDRVPHRQLAQLRQVY